MKRILLAGLLACLSLAAPALAAPLEAYGRLPSIEDVQISPDGQLLASSVTDGGEQRRIVVRRISDNSAVFAIAAGDAKLRDLRWAGSDHMVITSSRTSTAHGIVGGRREHYLALLVDIKNRKTKHLLALEENAMNVIARQPEVRTIDGAPTVFLNGFRLKTNRGLANSTTLYLTVFRHDIAKGRTSVVAQGEDGVADWAVAPDGTVLARSMYSEQSGRWALQMRDGGGWKIVAEDILPFGPPRLRGLGRTPNSVVTLSPKEAREGESDDDGADGERTLREYRLDGTWDLPLGASELIHDPATSLLIGASEIKGDAGQYVFFGPKAEAAWRAIVRAYPDQQAALVSWADNRRRIVVKVDDPKMGPAYALVDLDAKSAAWIGDVYRDIAETDVSPMQAISYKAQDGLEITGYLTLPRGKPAKNLPLIVLPHGGPAVRDSPGFDWWSQALASRGYAVLQPNFRGSGGLGAAFMAAGFGEWGRKMQTDVSDGVKHLAKLGIIDPKRTCIVGASYGGYAALAGVTVEQGVYRCAVSVAGVADLRRMLQIQSGPGKRNYPALRYWTNFMGADGARDPDLTPISPAMQAAKADAPILLIHGKDDTVVPYDQSRYMAEALKKAGKPYELITLTGEDHWLSRGATRLQMLQATVAFLERENPPN
ncbi:alpha/beta hydrolase family protein [Caulobacter sp. NIBR2454]|uniref:alpha/beta hydrolase family protein n=1 Tax=Caulobacter sp. NIBR2454 TaxID=3015996 RepID=UPI0022B61309|nr:S9 family peptidase [Caulobacter sp. NIBR2454]